jgi:mRNA interferase MazF
VPDPIRGEVWAVKLPDVEEDKYAVVISNNDRNRKLNSVLVARMTTAPKAPIPTRVPVAAADDPVHGAVACDDVHTLSKGKLKRRIGALTYPTMQRVAQGLRIAMSL